MYTYDSPAPITANLDVPAGRLQVVASDRTDTTVEVQPADPSRSRDVKAAEETTVDFRDGVLKVQAPTKNQYFKASGAIALTVQLPAGSRLEAKTASAEFRTVGRLGDLAYDSSHGPIEIEEAAGIRLSTAAADVTVGRLGGPAEIRTSKGDIKIAEATAGVVTLRTDAGSISVGAAAGVSASLDAGTTFGRISNSLKNDGTADLEIHASTSYGDISARSV